MIMTMIMMMMTMMVMMMIIIMMMDGDYDINMIFSCREELEQAQQVYLEQLERYENTHLGNFRRIFPVPGCEKYDKYFHSSGTVFQATAAFRARSELARYFFSLL